MTRPPFRVHGDRAAFTLHDSESVRVSPAEIEAPDGTVQGIAIFCRGVPRFTATLDAAADIYGQLDELLRGLGR